MTSISEGTTNTYYCTTAFVWKGGKTTVYANSTNDTRAVGAVQSGSDLYVFGTAYDSTNEINDGVYWKNGTMVWGGFTDNDTLESFALSGSDVYVGGYTYDTQDKACYWKNGVRKILLDTKSYVYAIAVSRDSVYAAGRYTNGVDTVACGWTNGVLIELTNVYSRATAVAVSGSDICFAGYFEYADARYRPFYWKNGTFHELTNASYQEGWVTAMTVSGSDVYMAGYYYDSSDTRYACYWKNGEFHSTGTPGSSASQIAVVNGDVYIAGYERAGETLGSNLHTTSLSAMCATIWKNGGKFASLTGLGNASFGRGLN